MFLLLYITIREGTENDSTNKVRWNVKELYSVYVKL